jgi:hypothetical protein
LNPKITENTVLLSETFEKFSENCLVLKRTKNMTFNLLYSPVERISAIKFYFPGDFWTKNLLHIEVKARIHSSRDCIAYKELSKTLFNNIYVTIICELNEFTDNAKEMIENPQSIQFSFESKKIFDTRICNLFVYQFQHNCGTPDALLQAYTNTWNSDKTVKFLPIPQRKNHLLIYDIIALFSALNFALTISTFLTVIFVRQKIKLMQKQIAENSKDVNDLNFGSRIERSDDMSYEFEENNYESVDFELGKYEMREYE